MINTDGAMFKEGQFYDANDAWDVSLADDPEPMYVSDSNDAEVMLEFDDPKQDPIVFELDMIPGAPDAQEIVVDDEIEAEEDQDVEIDDDPWNWRQHGMGGFLGWLSNMFKGVPRHSGYDTTGLEKCIAYFERMDRELTRAMREDYRNEIDIAKAESAREAIENGIERLIKRLEDVKTTKYKRHAKKKKSWREEAGFVKEAQKSTNIAGIMITVPLLISRIARVCINGMVSAGHDLEDLYASQVKEYNLDKREQAELQQLLADMGYVVRQDRGMSEGNAPTDSADGKDWATNYLG
jgi:competence protein ComGC